MTTKRMNHKAAVRGFTLIELLTVMIIISILAIISLGVQRASVQSARAARTRTTIAKIDNVISNMYEKYQYRKVNIPVLDDADLTDMSSIPIVDLTDAQILVILNMDEDDENLLNDTLREQARDINRQKAKMVLRTLMLRDMLRLDMPTNLTEVTTASLYGQSSPLHDSYARVAVNGMTNAELLYLIITNGDPETRTLFYDREIADANENGLNEFVDGWGNPIGFLRWAPGLDGSSRQPIWKAGRTIQSANRIKLSTSPSDDDCQILRDYLNPSDPDSLSGLSAAELLASGDIPNLLSRYPDPLDPMGLYDGWLLVPLVFSCGPDGEPGTNEPESFGTNGFCDDPFDGSFSDLGANNSAIDDSYLDNITNHNYYNE